MTDIERQHAEEVEKIRAQVRSFYAAKQKVKIYHGGTNSTRVLEFDPTKVVDVSNLTRVLKVNVKQKYVWVEPNVPMDKLVEETLKFGLIPPVVMEFPGITVGGGIQGGAGESSSFRHGLFHNICFEYEMICGDGQKVIASPEQNKDLYYGTVCSYGSLGVITAVKLRLIPAHRYVRLHYQRVNGFEEMLATIKSQTKTTANFIDGIMFSRDCGVIMSGNFTDDGDLPIATFHRARDEWFYLHTKKLVRRKNTHEELVPLKDYLFRYDRGAFWTGRFAFTLLKVPYTRLTRFLLDFLIKTRTLYRFLHASHLSQRYLVQDVALPIRTTREFLEFVDDKLGIYPLWLCPLKPATKEKLSANCVETDFVVSVGVYGEINQDFTSFVRLNKALEHKTAKLGGRKWLYAHSYYSKEEFWRIYDKKYYDKLRIKYGANVVFPDLYEKIIVKKQYQPSILAGFWGLVKSPFRLKP